MQVVDSHQLKYKILFQVSVLKRGMSFGELAIIRREERNANVIANSPVALLTVGREDFIDIFMHRYICR